MVAMVMVLVMVMGNGATAAAAAAVASPSRSHEQDLRGLWERVTSHTETLLNINYYLKQTDIFWKWFQENKERLDEILSEDRRSSQSPDNDQLLQRLDDLEQRQKARDEELQEMRIALEEEKEKTNDLEARIRHQEESEDILRREIPKLEERMAQLETQLVAVNQTTLRNKRDIDGRVTTDLNDLQQKTENLMEVVDESWSTSSDEINGLKESLDQVVVNIVFPLEGQLKQLNESQITLSEEAKQEFIDVKRQIRSLSTRVSGKQANNRGRGLYSQITNLQTSLANVQGQIAELDGRTSGFQQDQFEEALREQSKIQLRLEQLEKDSGNMNLEIKATAAAVDDLEMDFNYLKKNVTNLKQYNNITDHVRSIRVPNPAASSLHPIGPPGSLLSGSPSYPRHRRPGNQGWRGQPGDPGSRGAPGNPGSRGQQGSPGAPGGRGAPGSPGPRGEQGNRGSPGSRGAPGNAGSRGAPGGRGPSGSLGAPGNRGVPGSPGSRGSLGTRGTPGSSGSSGVRGSQGDPGNAGLRGPPGSPGMRGTTGSQGLRGAPGSPGAPGNAGRRGAPGAPGYPGSPGYTGYPVHQGYTSTSPAYAGYSATSGYAGYPSTAGYGGYYQG